MGAFSSFIRCNSSRPAIVLQALVLASALALSACSAPLPAQPTSAPKLDAPTELRVYLPRAVMSEDMLNAMLQATPDGARFKLIFVDATYDAVDQVPALIQQDKTPDLIWSSFDVASLVDAGLLLDLREQMSTDAQFSPDAIDERVFTSGQVSGRGGQYILPFMMDNVQLYYNKTMLQQARVSLPTPDWTWDDLIRQCQNLQSVRPGVTCLGLSNASDISYWYPWVRGYGGDVLSSDGTLSTLGNAQTVEGLQRYQELWTKHKVVTPVQFPTYVDCFVSQRCAMVPILAVAGRSLTQRVGDTFTWDTQLMPRYPKGRFTTGWMAGMGIAAASKHPAEAWAFLKLLISPEAQGVLLYGGYGLPVLKKLPPAAGRQLPSYMQPFLDGWASRLEWPVYPALQACAKLPNGNVWQTIDGVFSTAFYQHGNLAQLLPEADRKIQPCLTAAATPTAR